MQALSSVEWRWSTAVSVMPVEETDRNEDDREIRASGHDSLSGHDGFSLMQGVLAFTLRADSRVRLCPGLRRKDKRQE